MTYLSNEESSVRALLGAKAGDKIFFAFSAREAIHHLILSTFIDVSKQTGKNHFITSCIDEAPAILTMSRLEALGAVCKLCAVDASGRISEKHLIEAITPRTVLLSLSWANGLTGVVQPVDLLAKICRERGILLHVDATHVLGKLFMDLEEIRPDCVTFDGPKGSAVLYVRQGVPLEFHSEMYAPAFAGFVDDLTEHMDFVCTETARLRDKFEREVIARLPGSKVLFQEAERLPNISLIAFPYISNEALLFLLNRKGVGASMGGGNFQTISLILKACGLTESALSFTFSRHTTEEEIDRTVTTVVNGAKYLLSIAGNLIV